MPVSWVYQQENATIHMSGAARSWFSEHGVPLMDWPSRSPYLNPMENIWGWLARALYANNRQFSSLKDLTNCVIDEWGKLPHEFIKKLIESMKNRNVEVLKRQRLTTNY